jgi:hypothetical protein
VSRVALGVAVPSGGVESGWASVTVLKSGVQYYLSPESDLHKQPFFKISRTSVPVLIFAPFLACPFSSSSGFYPLFPKNFLLRR